MKYLSLRPLLDEIHIVSPLALKTKTTRITVWFKGGKPYSYSYNRAGGENVEEMKRLANNGAGLSAYITRNVRFLYD